MGDYLDQMNRYYDEMPRHLKGFCAHVLDVVDFNDYCTRFALAWPAGRDGRYALWTSYITKVLSLRMHWPLQPELPCCRIADLPLEDRELVIDRIGYEIGLPVSQGNDSLLRVYRTHRLDIERRLRELGR